MTQTTTARQAAEAAYQADPSTENLKALQAAGKAEMDEYLAGVAAREAEHRAAYEAQREEKEAAAHAAMLAQEAKEKAARKVTETPSPAAAPAPAYAAWFLTLLNERTVCADTEAFERAAYAGYVSYGRSTADGYYAPEDFDAWVTGFRKAPVPELYYGNDARHDLAPQAYDYARKVSREESRDRWGIAENRTNKIDNPRSGRVAHRFDSNGRAVCNWRVLPSAAHRMNDRFLAREDYAAKGDHIICPRCDAKS